MEQEKPYHLQVYQSLSIQRTRMLKRIIATGMLRY